LPALSSPQLSGSEQNVSSKTEYLSDTAAPAAIWSRSKSPHAVRCKLLAANTPASSRCPYPLPQSHDAALETRRAPFPPFPVAPRDARTRQSSIVPTIRPGQILPAFPLARQARLPLLLRL